MIHINYTGKKCFRDIRIELGMDEETASKKVGLAISSFRKMEIIPFGKVDIYHYQRLCEALDVDKDKLRKERG